MNIAIHVSNQVIAEAVYQLLVTDGYDAVVANRRSPANRPTPDVLLVDIATLTHDLLTRYPESKVLLMDIGIEKAKLYATLLSYKIHGVLSPDTGPHLFKKALAAVNEGQLWIDHGSVKALFDKATSITGKTSHISDREREVIELVRQGLRNNEIAERLVLSKCTVKTYLANIFRKFHITCRAQLKSLTTDSPPEGPA